MIDLQSLPTLPLANLPTPVEPLPRLSDSLGLNLLIKRDDLTGLAFGGNKTRKLSLLVAQAMAAGADCLVTVGAPQSNHCRQTAAAAASNGLACHLVLTGDPPQTMQGNILLDQLLGARLHWVGDRPRQPALETIVEQLRADGHRPYLIPYGGSNPYGVAAFALAMKELLDQVQDIDWLVFASSSGGTQAGLLLGAALYGFAGQILGISVDPDKDRLDNGIRRLLGETIDHFNLEVDSAAFSPAIRDEFRGEGYAKVGPLEREAVRQFARHEGILLDPVYTGRAAGAMLALIRSGEIPAGARVLFWHTGGTPALFAFADKLS